MTPEHLFEENVELELRVAREKLLDLRPEGLQLIGMGSIVSRAFFGRGLRVVDDISRSFTIHFALPCALGDGESLIPQSEHFRTFSIGLHDKPPCELLSILWKRSEDAGEFELSLYISSETLEENLLFC